MIRAQVRTVPDSEPRTLLKTIRDGAGPVPVLVSFAAVQGHPRTTGPGRNSQATDRADLPRTHVHRLGKGVGATPREFESRILRRRMRALQSKQDEGRRPWPESRSSRSGPGQAARMVTAARCAA